MGGQNQFASRAARFAVVLAAGLASAEVRADPTPGEIVPVEIGTIGNPLGYWAYVPPTYTADGEPWPMIVYLSGIGSVGTGIDDSPCGWPVAPADLSGASGLCNNFHGGIHLDVYSSIINNAPWVWPVDERPFIVISPQNPQPNGPYNVPTLDAFFDHVEASYNVDPRRRYLMGSSQGGRSVLLYLGQHAERFAASAVMPAGATSVDPCGIANLALWAFHGASDPVDSFAPQSMIDFMNAYNACPSDRPTGRFTMYLGAQHDVWTRTYRPATGMSDPVDASYDPYNVDIFTWFMQHDRPTVDAGPDFTTTADKPAIVLASAFEDDDPLSFEWTHVAGTPMTLGGVDSSALTITGLAEGMHTFMVRVVDSDGLSASDEVQLDIGPGVGGAEDGSSSWQGEATAGGSGVATGTTDAGGSESTGESGTTESSESTSSGASSDSGAGDSTTATAGDDGVPGGDGYTTWHAEESDPKRGSTGGCSVGSEPSGFGLSVVLVVVGWPRRRSGSSGLPAADPRASLR